MSVEQQGSQKIYQSFFPELRGAMGIKDKRAIAVNPQKAQEPIESIDATAEVKAHILEVSKRDGFSTLGGLIFIDPNNPPRGLGEHSINVIQKIQEEVLLFKETRTPVLNEELQEAMEILNLPNEPLNFPLSTSQMAAITGLADATFRYWQREGIIGRYRKTPGGKRWYEFHLQDLPVAAFLLKQGRWLESQERIEIAGKVKASLSQFEVPEKIIGDKRLNPHRLSKMLGASIKTVYEWIYEGYIGRRQRPEGRIQFSSSDINKAFELLWEREKRRKKRWEKPLVEKLTTLRNTLVKEKVEEKRLSLRQAANLLRKISQKAGFKVTYPSYETLNQLITISLWYGNLPLSEKAITTKPKGQLLHSLSKEDLETVFDVCINLIKTGTIHSITKSYPQAEKNLRDERKKRVQTDNLVTDILTDVWKTFKSEEKVPAIMVARKKKVIEEAIKEGRLVLPQGVRPQEVLTLGILPEYLDECKTSWTQFLKEEESKKEKTIFSRKERLRRLPSLSSFLRKQIGEVKVDPRSLSYIVSWLNTSGIPITIVNKTINTKKGKNNVNCYFLSSYAQKKLQMLLQNPEMKEKLLRILNQGFTPEEMQSFANYFPKDTFISLSHTLRLAGESWKIGQKERVLIVEALKQGGINLIEEVHPSGRTRIKVPLSQLQQAVVILKKTPEESSPPNLTETRVKEGLTRTQLAKLSGLSVKTIYNLEYGAKVSKTTKHKIVNGLNNNPLRKRLFTFEEVFPTN